jgi:hypothetical protein
MTGWTLPTLYQVQCGAQIYSLFYSVWCCSVASVYPALAELRGLEIFRKINLDQILEIYKDNADNEGLKKEI